MFECVGMSFKVGDIVERMLVVSFLGGFDLLIG